MNEHPDAEDYSVFTYGDSLHADGQCDDNGTQVWIGFVPFNAMHPDAWTAASLYLPTADTVVPAILSTYFEEYEDDTIVFGWHWNPVDQPYWHRASHCPNKEV